ncbi:MAG: hypothetical protein ABIZ56_01625, partial [Chthoniobacteraceae bacterium]
MLAHPPASLVPSASSPVEQGVEPVAQHRPQPRPIEPLPQQVLARPRGLARDVGAGHQVAAQECAQRVRVEPVRFDLRGGDEPRFERMRQDHFFDLLDVFEQIVREPPVPARFEHRLARPLQSLEELNEAVRGVPLNAGFPQRPGPVRPVRKAHYTSCECR